MLAAVLTAASLALQMHGPWPSMVIQGSPARLMRPSIRRAPTPLAAVEAMPRPVSIAPFETGSAVITNLTTHHLDAPESLAFHGVVHPVKSSPWPLVRARALLVGASALWGTYAVVLRLLYQAPGPTLSGEFVSAMRFQVLTAVALGSAVAPALRGRGRKMRFSAPLLRDSFLLAVVGFFGSFCSTVSVAHLAALPSEVLLGTVNLFVPIQTVLLGKRVGIRTWVGCGLCFLAVCTVAVFGSVSAAGAVSWPHMLMLLGSAKLYALGRVGAQWCVAHRGYEAEALNLARMIFMGLLAQVVLAASALRGTSSTRVLLQSLGAITFQQKALIVVSALSSAFLGSMLQYKAYRVVPAASAQPFLSLQALFAALWAFIFLAEPVGPAMMAAGAMIMSGTLLAAHDRSEVH